MEWRSTAVLDPLLEHNDGVSILVLTGNCRWMAYHAVAAARGAGFSAASNLPADEVSLSVFSEIAGRADLGARSGTTLGVLSLATIFLPTPVPVALTVGAASLAAPTAVRWLQDRRWDAVFVETAALIEELPDLRLVVVDLDAASPQDGAHLVELLDRRRSEKATPLAVLLIVDEWIASSDAVGSWHPAALRRLAEWAGRGEVAWFAVPPLESEGVRDLLACDELTATLLVEDSGGQDLEVERLWAHWRTEKLVVENAGQWQATARLERHERQLTEVLARLEVPTQIARDLLGMAAQFGLRFCATSVVRAWQDAKPALGDSAEDDLQDVFDGLEAEGVLTSEGHLLSDDGTPCWIYGFRNAEYRARAVCLLPASERSSAAKHVLKAAADLHHAAVAPSGAELLPETLDRELSRLARQFGFEGLAERHQRRLERAMQIEELTTHVALLLRAAAIRHPDDPYPWQALYAAAAQADDLDEHDTAVAAVDEALAIAEDLERRRELAVEGVERNQGVRCSAHAVRSSSYGRLAQLHGQVHAKRGEHSEALRTLTLARLHFEQAAAESATGTAIWHLASAERDLALSVQKVRGHEAALPGLQRAQLLSDQLVIEEPTPFNRQALAVSEGELAKSVREVHGHKAALPGLERAQLLFDQLVIEEPTPTGRQNLAVAESELALSVREVHGHEAALPGLQRAQRLTEQVVTEGPTPTLTLLWYLAVFEFRLALSVQEVHGDEKALPGLRRAQRLLQQLVIKAPTATHRHDLAAVELRLAQSVQAVHGDKQAAPLLQRAGQVIRSLAEDYPSSQLDSWLRRVELEIARIDGGRSAP